MFALTWNSERMFSKVKPKDKVKLSPEQIESADFVKKDIDRRKIMIKKGKILLWL